MKAASAGEVLLGVSSLRLSVLELVMQHREVTALDLMYALDLTRNGVGKHLDDLTEAGFLIERNATHPRGTGGVKYWRADRERIARELWALQGRLLGYDGPGSAQPESSESSG